MALENPSPQLLRLVCTSTVAFSLDIFVLISTCLICIRTCTYVHSEHKIVVANQLISLFDGTILYMAGHIDCGNRLLFKRG